MLKVRYKKTGEEHAQKPWPEALPFKKNKTKKTCLGGCHTQICSRVMLCGLCVCFPPFSSTLFCVSVCGQEVWLKHILPSWSGAKHTWGSLPGNQPPHKRSVLTPLVWQVIGFFFFLALCILFSPPGSKTSPVCYDQLLSSHCLLKILPFVFDCIATCSFFWTLGIRVCGQRLYFHLSSVSYSTTIVLTKHRRNMELSITS